MYIRRDPNIFAGAKGVVELELYEKYPQRFFLWLLIVWVQERYENKQKET